MNIFVRFSVVKELQCSVMHLQEMSFAGIKIKLSVVR
jgi:hypothetical protein